jgi:hypothetical protein
VAAETAESIALAVAHMERVILERVTASRDDIRIEMSAIREEVRTLFAKAEAAAGVASQLAGDAQREVRLVTVQVGRLEATSERLKSDVDKLAQAFRDTEVRNKGRLDVVRFLQALIAGGAFAGAVTLFEALTGTT